MTAVSKLYIDFMNLVGLDFYTKSESDNKYALKSEIQDSLTVDSSLSSSSTNPVQNKVIKSALEGKANSSHNHTVSQITDFPSIPSKTSDLTNDAGFLTSHQDITGKVNVSDVKDNLTSTDTDKPLSANQGRLLSNEKANKSELSAVATSGSYKDLEDKPLTMAPTTHNHDSSYVFDTSAYSNIGSSANATQKTINNNINTKLGEKAVASNVYSKSETYTQEEVTALISNAVADLQLFEVVNELPSSNIKTNRLYLIVNDENITNNLYDIYLRVNNGWEQLDGLNLDISNFYTKTEIDTFLNGKVDTSDSRLTNARTPTRHTHGNITNTGAIGTTANLPIITTTNGKLTTGSFGTTANTFAQGNHNHGNLLTDGTLTTVKTSIVSNDKFAIIDSSNNKLSSASVVDVVNQLILDLITEANK